MMINKKNNHFQSMRAIASSYIKKKQYASIEWYLKKDGKVIDIGRVSSESTGLADNAIYRIYSMTKPIVAVLGVIFLERFKIRLYTPLSDVLPEFRDMVVLKKNGQTEKAKPITIQDLFMHQAGFSYDFLTDCPVGKQYNDNNLLSNAQRSLKDFVQHAADFPLAFQPGSRWQYSIATDILARVLEVVGGQSLDNLLEKEIFDPLHMMDTNFYVKENQQHRLATMYGKPVDQLLTKSEESIALESIDVESDYPSNSNGSFIRGGHGLFSTLDDYMKFACMTLRGLAPSGEQLISRKMVDFMWLNRLHNQELPYWLGPFISPGYGFNLIGRVMIDLNRAISLTSEGEGGWGGAAGTYYWVDRRENFSGVIMTQNLGSLSSMRADMLSAAYQGI